MKWVKVKKLIPSQHYLFKVEKRNTRKRCEICSKLTITYITIIIDVILVFLMLTLNIFQTFSGVSIVDFERLNVSWGIAALILRKLSKTIAPEW